MLGDAAAEALSSLHAAVDDLNAVALWRCSDADARANVRAGFAVLQAVEGAWLRLVADLDARAIEDGVSTKAFLREGLHRTPAQAAADVRAARAVGSLVAVADALAAGEVSRAHVDAVAKTLERIPEPARHRLVDSTADFDADPVTVVEAVDVFFADKARRHDSHQVQALGQHLLATLDPDGADGFSPTAHERRRECHALDAHGMLVGHFVLDKAGGATLAAALDHFSAPHPRRTETADDGSVVDILDDRTPGQRRADGLVDIARLALTAAAAGTKGGEAPRIVIHTTLSDYHDLHCPSHEADAAGHVTVPADFLQPAPTWTPRDGEAEPRRRVLPGLRMHGGADPHLGAISPTLLARLSCDATLQTALLAPTGAILDLGRDTRTITPAQRRALTARDRGCVIPGCTAPAAWCQGHHVRWWSHGGHTDLDELALLCPHHHTQIHLGTWTLEMRDGIPWARPPRAIDPHQRWLRNTTHTDTDHARHLGHRLRQPPPDAECA